MVVTLDLPTELVARIDAIATRSTLTPSEIVTDALHNGQSLDWQEHYLDSVERGIADADKGNFASPEELARVVNKYRFR